jgi:hypothetical protein
VPAADGRRVRGGGGGLLGAGAVALLALGGFNIIRTVADAASPPPVPPASAARVLPAPKDVSRTPQQASAVGTASRQPAFAAAMPPSTPVRVTVPRVGIDAKVISVGMTHNGAVGVPPITDALKAGWYDKGPTPGENGPAVIDAHVDSVDLPERRAAFFALGAVRPGDLVEVTRADGMVAEFTVDSVEVVRKRDFPTAKVYGPVTYAGLRLITCGGEFIPRDGYLDNIVVYAHLTGEHRA